jgi:hypothetical protein
MYSNIELMLNPSIAPVYLTATNMVMPIITMTNTAIVKFMVNVASKAEDFFATYLKTTNIGNVNLLDSYKLYIVAGILLITFVLMIADKIAIMYTHDGLNKRVKELEHQINYMKKAERMRENDWELLMQSYSQSFKQLQGDFNKKFTNYDKQIKKMDKELKLYQ